MDQGVNLENLPFAENAFSVSKKEPQPKPEPKIEKKSPILNSVSSKTSGNEIIMCPYKGNPREIFTAVCIWHRREKDPECFAQKCPRVALKK